MLYFNHRWIYAIAFHIVIEIRRYKYVSEVQTQLNGKKYVFREYLKN